MNKSRMNAAARAGKAGRAFWAGLCLDAASEPLSALCLADYSSLARDPALREIMLKALDEAAKISQKSGCSLSLSTLERSLLQKCRKSGRRGSRILSGSLYQRRSAREAALGPFLAAARQAKTPAPILSRFFRLLRRLEKEP